MKYALLFPALFFTLSCFSQSPDSRVLVIGIDRVENGARKAQKIVIR